MVTREQLKKEFAPPRDEWEMIHPEQEVDDIINEVLDAHETFYKDYDRLAKYFEGKNEEETARNIAKFLGSEIRYREEPERAQTTSLPAGILYRGYGDCKHYSSLAGGILDAISRKNGKPIDWAYRFASYDLGSTKPHHVFVVVKDKKGEIWIDPTPGADKKEPVYFTDAKPNTMALYRQIGSVVTADGSLILDGGTDVDMYIDFPQASDDLPQDVIEKISFLFSYGIFDEAGNYFPERILQLANQVSPDIYNAIINANESLQAASLSGLFGDLWRGVKKVTLALPRGAFLSMVSLNVFGLATKLKQAMSTYDGHKRVSDTWYSLGGDLAIIKKAIENGYKKPKILGATTMGAAPAAVPAWVATASAILAALVPVINSVLKQQQAANDPLIEGYDPSLINVNPSTLGGSDIMKILPWVGLAAVALYFFTRQGSKK